MESEPRKSNGTFQLAIPHPDPLFADEGCSCTIVNRFWKHVRKTGYCWNWVGGVDAAGTGVIGRGGKGSGNIKARRVSWLIHFRVPANRRIWVTCGNPVCVNPAHFKIGYGAPMPELLPDNQIIQPAVFEEADYSAQDPGLPAGFSRTFMKRFLAKIDRTSSPYGCWLWIRGKNQDGYGSIGRGRNQKSNAIGAHVASWLIYKGPIPKGLVVCHNCPGGDNPACCNPDHLFLGPPKANTHDAIGKAERNGKIHWRSNLSPDDRSNIIKDFAAGNGTKAEIARRYRTSKSAVGRILNHHGFRAYFKYSVSGVVDLTTHTGNMNCQTIYTQWPTNLLT